MVTKEYDTLVVQIIQLWEEKTDHLVFNHKRCKKLEAILSKKKAHPGTSNTNLPKNVDCDTEFLEQLLDI